MWLSLHKHLVLLGAGASSPLGVPTMTQLTEQFEETLSNNPKELQLLAKAKQAIRKNGFFYDAESLYTYLLGCADPNLSFKKAGPYVASKCRTQPVAKIRRSVLYSRIREKLEEHVINKCYIGEEYERRRADALFTRFFAKISGVNDWENSEPVWDDTVFEIFTTNYDNAVERYGINIGKIPFVGYQKTANEEVLFTPEQYDQTEARIKLYKLHGSIELSLLEDNTIVSVEPPTVPGRKYKGKKIRGKIIVYGPEKNLIAEPYFELLVRLKKYLTKAHECTVVGYSFRDPWIYQIFQDAALRRRQRTPWIEYISPSATYTISQLPEISAFVHPIDQSFQQYLNLPMEE